jgi:hypothetical protein
MRGSGTHPPTAALFPSPIHAKFLSPGKLRKALCQRVFNSYTSKIHPHDFKKTHFFLEGSLDLTFIELHGGPINNDMFDGFLAQLPPNPISDHASCNR